MERTEPCFSGLVTLYRGGCPTCDRTVSISGPPHASDNKNQLRVLAVPLGGQISPLVRTTGSLNRHGQVHYVNKARG